MNQIKAFFVLSFIMMCVGIQAQNLHHFFVKDAFQRSYFNPALNDEHFVSFASGLGVDVSTTGPSIADFTEKVDGGGLLIDAANAIEKMNDENDIFGYASVNTFDASVDLKFARISVGHAWIGNGWFEYSQDLAKLVTFGNGDFVGETLNLGPQIDYISYNEVYLGLQKNIGPLSIGAKIKRLSGVEAIKTENSKIDLTTSDDIYQLTLDSDFELNTSSAFNYIDIDNFTLDIENYSFDNFLSANTGWAFDIGASVELGDRAEVSLSIVDIGGMTWDTNVENYTSNSMKTIDGIDLSDYITNDREIAFQDSLEEILDIVESNNSFTTTLPTQIYLGGTFKLDDTWRIGALIHSVGSGDRRSNAIAFNATASINDVISIGGLYSIQDNNLVNIGLHSALKIGPVLGFLSTDNVIGLVSPNSNKGSNLRAGLSVGF